MKEQSKSILSAIKIVTLPILSVIKSVWRSSLSVLYLVVYSFLQFALLNYYGLNELRVMEFTVLLNFLVDNWEIFWVAFFISNSYDDWRWSR